ncbi:phage holin [Lactobacillus delbrueckii subsp. bulgaricus]|uniref:phage holin n=1 Tax=Lactobacillus delbrueckii TaxID=1584 RepID=UPI0004A5C6EB|nr:phage holin [Lactobacillus delbrueckii]MCD5464844.1 phage holin [Lactobacillus delbrueckii subsp. bulgaricus]MCD5482419.1 phage holin [Lactobacillus delbrueckii subsp. bulgaricus]MCD5482471.1 phage holin [Lactobacillus delbrueckii subsp. bulgaricus]MCT3468511.1 phage holin [Lactobacillus delbrueckii subsp. bulgaricus]CDR75510.1 ORF107 [Lactobacillus delbrueckii subsp. bulgaricus]
MSLTDWLNLIVAIGTIALAVVASLYLRYKTKIDTKTAAGKVFDVIGKLAVWAVNEAEHSDLAGDAKREYAAEIIAEQLQRKGITGITKSTVYGAIQAAWKAADFNHGEKPAESTNTVSSDSANRLTMDDAPVEVKKNND